MAFQDGVGVLLHQIEGPVNLGAVCRAMANTGFSKLAFTGDLQKDAGDARKYAVHARDILDMAVKHPDLKCLIQDRDLVFGFTPRNPWPDGRGLNLDQFHEVFEEALSQGKQIGLLFGNEARGLQNEHLAHCHYRVSLPVCQAYVSMNLSQAVLVTLWELRRQAGLDDTQAKPDPEMGGPEDKEQLLNNIHRFLETIEFLNPQNPDHLWQEVMPLFATRDWSKRELTLLHAIFGKARSRYLASLRKKNS